MFIGWVNPDELRELIKACDALVQPGTLSNTFVEAVCIGTPLVLADSPQARDLIFAKNGIIYILIPSFMISYISKPFEKSCYLFEKKKWHIFSSIMKLSFISIAVVLSYLFKADFSVYVLFYCIATCAHYFIDFCYNYHLISRS